MSLALFNPAPGGAGVRACDARSCPMPALRRVLTRKAGSLHVCAAHERVLREAGEIVDRRPLLPIRLESPMPPKPCADCGVILPIKATGRCSRCYEADLRARKRASIAPIVASLTAAAPSPAAERVPKPAEALPAPVPADFPVAAKLEDGSPCPENGCDGTMRLIAPSDCSCHISPPCTACVERALECESCGFNPGDTSESAPSAAEALPVSPLHAEAAASVALDGDTHSPTCWTDHPECAQGRLSEVLDAVGGDEHAMPVERVKRAIEDTGLDSLDRALGGLRSLLGMDGYAPSALVNRAAQRLGDERGARVAAERLMEDARRERDLAIDTRNAAEKEADDAARELRKIRAALGLSTEVDGSEVIAEIKSLRRGREARAALRAFLSAVANGGSGHKEYRDLTGGDQERVTAFWRACRPAHNTLRDSIAQALGYGDGAGTTTDDDLVAELRQRVDGAREDALADESLQIAHTLGIDTTGDNDLLATVREVAGLAMVGLRERIAARRAAVEADEAAMGRLARGLAGGAS